MKQKSCPNTLVVVATLLLLALPLAGRAQFTFTTNSGSITITGYTGTDASAVIPSATNGYPVRGIGADAFYQNTNVMSVTIPDSVTVIGMQAFEYCSGLTNVAIGNSVLSVGSYAFENCSNLTSVTLPASLHSIGNGSFFGCSSLTSVVIPSSVTAIGSYAFGNCVFLSTAYFQGNAPTAGSSDKTVFSGNNGYFSEAGIVYYLPGTTGWGATFGSWPTVCPTNTTPISAFTFANNNGAITITSYVGTNQDVVLPGSINGYPVTTIGDNTFGNNSNLRSVLLPDSVTSIGNQAFYNCRNLVSAPLPVNLASIGTQAFALSDGMTYMTIPSGVTNIGTSAFMGCYSLLNISVAVGNPNYAGLGGVLFDNAFTTLIQYPSALAGNYIVPNSVTNIGSGAFYTSTPGLTSVTIPVSVLNIGSSAFPRCSYLQSITVAGDNPNYTSVGGVLFDKARSTLIRYPGGLPGNYVISNRVTCIGESAFAYCRGVTSVVIPDSVTNIGQNAFTYCINLHQAYFRGSAPSVNGGAGSADSTVFQGESGTVFYQGGTTGWSGTFGGWPTTAGSYQPQPQIIGSGPGLGGPSNGFQFTIFWATNTAVVVEASTNLLNWTPVITNTLINGTSAWMDSTWTNYPQQFYRARAQ